MTWNIEGLKRNIFNLRDLLNIEAPHMIFLSETQIFQSDINHCVNYLAGVYSYHLNSEDQFDKDLPLVSPKSVGGTMTLWRNELDPFITLHPPPSPSILPIIFHPPGCTTSLHLNVYLPTNGREDEFMEEMSKLFVLVQDLAVVYPAAPIYIRGDLNVNNKNSKRKSILKYFLDSNNLDELKIDHPTYHHFVGDGTSDSNLDRIIFSSRPNEPEMLLRIICKLNEPLVCSLHDVIITS